MIPTRRSALLTWALLAALLTREHPPRRLRLTLVDGSAVEIERPSIRGDSLVGQMKVTIAHPDQRDEKRNVDGAVALADIRAVELRKADASRARRAT